MQLPTPSVMISIHALREEGDQNFERHLFSHTAFQSTLSVGRATAGHHCAGPCLDISIHALRGESDSKSGEKIHHVCSIIHACAQFEKELYKGSGEMKDKSC